MEGGGGWGCVDVILWTELCLCCICEFSLVCFDVEFLVFFLCCSVSEKTEGRNVFSSFFFFWRIKLQTNGTRDWMVF